MSQTSEQYAKSGGDCCPNCEGGHINADGNDMGEAGRMCQQMYCDDCNATWEEQYQLIAYRDLDLEIEESEEETEKEETEDEPEEDQEES